MNLISNRFDNNISYIAKTWPRDVNRNPQKNLFTLNIKCNQTSTAFYNVNKYNNNYYLIADCVDIVNY